MFSDKNAYELMKQEKSNMSDFDELMENKSDSKILSIQNEGEPYNEDDLQDKDIPETP